MMGMPARKLKQRKKTNRQREVSSAGRQKEQMQVFLHQGLAAQEARKRLREFGPNQIEKKREVGAFAVLVSQLKSPLIYILIIAALVTIFLKDYVDAGVIGLAVVVNTLLGFYQERKAQRAIAALSELLSPKATVIREGNRQTIGAEEVVVGDVCLVGLGEKIPADSIVVEADDFSVTEAILTGESVPVHKHSARSLIVANDLEGLKHEWKDIDRNSKVFAGTIAASGNAFLIVSAIGIDTEVGKIARSLVETVEEPTPLQKRITVLSNQLALFIGVIAVLIFVSGMLVGTGEETELVKRFEMMFTTSVAVAVAAIPEGLAVSLTVILAIGMQRILHRRALVRKLMAAETLGSVTVICADKTGTLTEGIMRVTETVFMDEKLGVQAAILSNDKRDPLEVSMWNWVREKKRVDPQRIVEANPRVDAIPFSPERKFTAKLYKDRVYLMGAPEVVLSFCKMPASAKQRWSRKFDEYGMQGLRIVGFASRASRGGERKLAKKGVQSNLEWLGLVVYEDPVRRGVARVLSEAKKAGISVKVITGDYRATAEAVLERLGLLSKLAKLRAKHSLVLEGPELERLSDDELRSRVAETVLFARIDPIQKLRIVEALQANGEVLAMTGDGVNDAPALKRADIGIVVSGASDVAKETADMVLMDDNFATILAAVEEGRGIFDNLRKVILYLLSDSFSEVILILGSLLMRIPLPLTAAQILWINLITDGFPHLALTVEPKDSDLMRQKPRDPREPLVDAEIKVLIFLISVVTGLITLAAFFFFWNLYSDIRSARSLAFTMLGIDSLVYVFSARSLREPVWKTRVLANPWLIVAVMGGFVLQVLGLYVPFLQRLLQTRPLTLLEWGAVVLEVILVIGTIETVKWLFLRQRRIQRQFAKTLAS